MKDPITFLLNLFGYEYNKPSLLKMYMLDVTNENYLAQLARQNRLDEYLIKN